MFKNYPDIIQALIAEAETDRLRYLDLSSFMSGPSLEDVFEKIDRLAPRMPVKQHNEAGCRIRHPGPRSGTGMTAELWTRKVIITTLILSNNGSFTPNCIYIHMRMHVHAISSKLIKVTSQKILGN